MPSFRPATLIELIDHEPSGDDINGEAIMWISRNERGGMDASGTFRSKDARLDDDGHLSDRSFQYEGPAYEATREHEIRVLVFVVSVQGELYELEALTEPVVVQKADQDDEPAAVPDRLEYLD